MSNLEPLSYTPKQVTEVTGIAFTRVREAIASGELESVLSSANRRVVLREAVVAWLHSMPTEKSA